VESRGFGILSCGIGLPTQRTHQLGHSAPSWLGENPHKDTTSCTERGKFLRKGMMRVLDLEVALGSL